MKRIHIGGKDVEQVKEFCCPYGIWWRQVQTATWILKEGDSDRKECNPEAKRSKTTIRTGISASLGELRVR